MYDLAFALNNHRDDRFDVLMPNPSVRGIRNRNEIRRAALRVRRHVELVAQARGLAAGPAPTVDAPNMRDTLAAWDAAQADARAHFAAQDEAYRLSRLLPDRDGIESPSPVWQAVLNGLAPVEA